MGPPEIRHVDAGARYFTPFRVRPHAEAMRMFANGGADQSSSGAAAGDRNNVVRKHSPDSVM